MYGLGEILKFYRINKELTQKEVAKLVGVSNSTYSKIESNIQEPNLKTLTNLSIVLGFSIDNILKELSTEENKLNKTISLKELKTFVELINKITK